MDFTCPRISIITPSFNQAPFLERTIRSVLDQNYLNLEYIIIDGGSTDGSVEIIKRYEPQLAYWVSEPDQGQSHAINKGLQRATGEWVGWQNSDDIYYPNALNLLVKRIQEKPNTDFVIGDVNLIDAQDQIIRDMRYVCPSYESLLAEGMVLTNQAAFWKRSLHQQHGWLNESLHYGFDYEWFLRIMSSSPRCEHVSELIGALRYHGETKSSKHQKLFVEEYDQILSGKKSSVLRKKFFLIRRLLLTLADGRYSYVARGALRRVCNIFSNPVV